MKTFRWIQRAIPLAAVTLLGAAPMVLAQGQQVFEWSGFVDREVQITMRGNQLYTQRIGNSEPGRARSHVFAQIPRRDGRLVVQVLNGRGNVDVIQQPSPENGFSAIVRVQDPRSGSDNYRITGYWESYSNGDVINGRGRGVGRGRGRDNDNNDRNRGYDNRDIPRNPNGQYGQYGDRTMLHWSGNVDDQLEIRIQGNRVDYRTLSGQQPTAVRSDRANLSMPRTSAQVSVVQNQGRGQVWVVQQPSSLNGYTTVIRVRDPQGGYGFYDFNLMWQ